MTSRTQVMAAERTSSRRSGVWPALLLGRLVEDVVYGLTHRASGALAGWGRDVEDVARWFGGADDMMLAPDTQDPPVVDGLARTA